MNEPISTTGQVDQPQRGPQYEITYLVLSKIEAQALHIVMDKLEKNADCVSLGLELWYDGEKWQVRSFKTVKAGTVAT